MIKKIGTAIAASALFASVFAPSAFADVEISGNGEFSHNSVTVNNSNTTVVEQTSITHAHTDVNTSINTGSNQANGNTGGGGVSITSGDATNTVHVTVTGGDNLAILENHCGCSQTPEVTIADNGEHSKNKVKLSSSHTTAVDQFTKTKARTYVDTKLKTGKNKANSNTGSGSIDLTSGDAENTVDVMVSGGFNSLNP